MKRAVTLTWVRRPSTEVSKSFRLKRCPQPIITRASLVATVAVVLAVLITNPTAYAGTEGNEQPHPGYTDTLALIPATGPAVAPTATPAPEPIPQHGDKGEQVQLLQERLMDLGYLELDEPSQEFGPATKLAVERFQRQHNLRQTGIADAETRARIFSSEAQPYALSEGARGSDVDSLQRKLVDLGYLNENEVTGQYGIETVSAVKALQKRNMLDVDGRTGPDTLELIYSPDAESTASLVGGSRTKADREKMVSVAQKQIGKPYVLGKTGPASFDCSGLVYYCLKMAGSNRKRYNAAGYASIEEWNTIARSDLKRGDLMFFWSKKKKKIGHVAIYIGNGTVIDASSSNGKVVKRSCTGHWFTTMFRLAKRPW